MAHRVLGDSLLQSCDDWTFLHNGSRTFLRVLNGEACVLAFLHAFEAQFQRKSSHAHCSCTENQCMPTRPVCVTLRGQQVLVLLK